MIKGSEFRKQEAAGTIETEEQLMAACRRWQGRLRLLDWHVQCRFVPKESLGEECDADIHFCEARRSAEIRILEPGKFEESWEMQGLETVEHCLVHELLHLHFVPLNELIGASVEPSGIALEQAINALSEALIG